MDKKGFTIFSDVVNVIFIIVILIAFSFVMVMIDKSNWSTHEKVVDDLYEEVMSFEGEYVILNYLRTSVSDETREILGNLKISDIIFLLTLRIQFEMNKDMIGDAKKVRACLLLL